MHCTSLRRANVDALQLILGRDLPLREFGEFGPDIGDLLGVLAAHVLIDLNHLQLDFGNLALGLGDGRNQLPALAFEPGRLALQRIDPGLGHQLLVVECPDAHKLSS